MFAKNLKIYGGEITGHHDIHQEVRCKILTLRSIRTLQKIIWRVITDHDLCENDDENLVTFSFKTGEIYSTDYGI